MTSVRQWSERSRRNLEGIHPDLRRVMDRALGESPVDFIAIEGLRTRERQAEMVRTGASRTMNSRHLTGHAVDLLPIDPRDGKGKFDWPLYHQLAPAVKRAAADLNISITWGGDWTSFRDGPHFELSWHDYPAAAPWPKQGPVTAAVESRHPTHEPERDAWLEWLINLFKRMKR
jgi:peptidoglycan L-alanyl-D-glutamate endopeptidase CwlK